MQEKDLAYYLHSLLYGGLEYIAIINSKGKIIEEARRNFRLPKEKLEMFCMAIRLQHSMNGDFDQELGTVDYIVTERKNMKFVSIQVSSNILLAASDKNFNFIPMISKMTSKQFLNAIKEQLSRPFIAHLEMGSLA